MTARTAGAGRVVAGVACEGQIGAWLGAMAQARLEVLGSRSLSSAVAAASAPKVAGMTESILYYTKDISMLDDMTAFTLLALAGHLHGARLDRREVERLTVAHPDLDLDAAYLILRAGVTLREAHGERIVGYKMGLTSDAKRKQMNLDTAIYGVLTDQMQVPHEATFRLAGGIHPKIEPEIAFRTARPLRGRPTLAEVQAACDGVAAALEILDSRYVGFRYFSLPDVVADNSSSSHFVVGPWSVPSEVDVSDVAMTMAVDGEVVQAASSAAISGNPWQSLVDLVAMLFAHGEGLPAGSVVLAGAATTAVQLTDGMRVTLRVVGLGDVAVVVR